jgi:hypothetical protein
MNHKTLVALEQFDHSPDSALVTLTTSAAIASRSRASLYRDNRAGRLPFVKVGTSTRVRVGDLRKLIGAA